MKRLLVRLSVWCYRIALFRYPRRLRQRFGPDMLELFESLTIELVARRGFRGLLEAWWRCGLDLAKPLPSEPSWTAKPGSPGELDHATWEEAGGMMKMTGLWNDARFVLRGLFRAPGFTAITVTANARSLLIERQANPRSSSQPATPLPILPSCIVWTDSFSEAARGIP